MTTIMNNAGESTLFFIPEMNNEMLALGYKFAVEGDWETNDRTDPWSGMPCVDRNLHFFTDRDEAETYAATQTWVFNSNIHGKVIELKREETNAEREEREAREKEERKAKKIARDLEKGITPEMRKAMTAKKRHESAIRKMEAEIERLKAEIEAERAEVERCAKWLAEETEKANG